MDQINYLKAREKNRNISCGPEVLVVWTMMMAVEERGGGKVLKVDGKLGVRQWEKSRINP